MKKKLTLLGTMLLLVAMLVGCGEKNAKYMHDLKIENYVTLGEYKGLAVTAPAVKVDEEEKALVTREFYNQYITKENGGVADGTVKNGDYVNIDYEGKKDGVAFAGGTAQNQQLGIGTNTFIPGFEAGLVGVKAGQTVDLNLTFPENYDNAELAGQETVFTVTVNFIYPEFKDEIVASFGEEAFKNVEELEAYVQKYLETLAQSNYDYVVENSVLTQFLANCTYLQDAPEGVTAKYRTRLMENIQTEASYYNMDAESYCQMNGVTLTEYLDTYSKETAKQMLAMVALAKQEGLLKTDKDLDAAIQQAATDAGYTDVKEFMGENTRDDYQEAFAFEAALKFLVDNATITVQ